MCYKEFIAYQCGHRSMGVVRPCPMTTAGHNFPVCGIPPDKPHYAETMCTACERQLHSRWVLIREWEHRWLHERGVCGCDVTFPGLLTTPRVIGETSVAGAAASATGTAPAALEDKGFSASKAITAAEGSNDGHPESRQGDEKAMVDGRIPALFSEGVTDSGEHRVAIRLPSLYAAEWRADHRALHDAGKCSCPTTFTPFQPQVRSNELTPTDQTNLHRWRDLEAEAERNKADSRDIDGQVDETMKRLAEIDKAFGKFQVDDEPPKVKLPRIGGPTTTAETRPTDTRSQGSGNNNSHGRFHDNHRRRHTPPSNPRNNKPYHPPHTNTHTHTQPQLVISPTPPPSTSTPAGQPRPRPGTGAVAGAGYVYPEYPAHTTPYYFPPAHPTYATHATFTDAIPHGAHPWAGEPQATPGMPWMTRGPGPFRTPGFSYGGSSGNGQGFGQGQGQGQWYGGGGGYGYHGGGGGLQQGYGQGGEEVGGQVPVERHLPAPTSVSISAPEQDGADNEHGDGNGNDKGKQVAQNAQSSGTNTAHPLCGLPIGAGPEGTSHMPSWLGCPLRRSASTATMVITTGEEGDAMTTSAAGGDEGIRGTGEEQQEWDREGEGGHGAEDEGETGEEGRLLPPSPPQRRHSAAT